LLQLHVCCQQQLCWIQLQMPLQNLPDRVQLLLLLLHSGCLVQAVALLLLCVKQQWLPSF
jgi:hypothetical protein